MKPTILVSGATGKVGTEVTKQLLQKGYPVRAMVRHHDARSERKLFNTILSDILRR